VTIGGDLVGGSATGNQDLTQSGYVTAGRIGNLTIGGSVIAGVNQTSGNFANNGAIRVADDLGSVLVKGSLVGNDTNPVIISARGTANVKPGSMDVAMGWLTVNGQVERAKILAGYDTAGKDVNADAQIGPVSIGSDWIASSMIAGVKDAGFNGKDDPAVHSKIASVTIGGQVMGIVGGNEQFVFMSNEIGSFSVGGTPFAMMPGALNDSFMIGATGDVELKETV